MTSGFKTDMEKNNVNGYCTDNRPAPNLERLELKDKGKMTSEDKSTDLEESQVLGDSRTRRTIYMVTLCILLTEAGERITYYSLTANIILFAKSELGYEDVDAATINQVFTGILFFIPIGGGFIADSYYGRFKTITGFLIIYLSGIILALVSAIEFSNFGGDNLSEMGRRGFFLGGLALVALGTGGIKPNVGPFGAEQLEAIGKDAVQSFFSWYYWIINVGAFLSYSCVSYIQQEISFAWGFLIPLLAMTMSLLLFVAMKNKYIQTDPQGSILATAVSIFGQGCCKKQPEPVEYLPEGTEKRLLARAKISYGGTHKDHIVDGVSSVIRVIPFCALCIVYWGVYTQKGNTFYVQSSRMDIRMGNGVNVPVASLNIAKSLTIMILIPFLDKILYPKLEKMGMPLSHLKKIGIGMILAAIALFLAGIVEIERKRLMNEPGGCHIQTMSDKNYTASSLSIFVQIPQFSIVGASEVFVSVSSLAFAYEQAPVSMQGLLVALFLSASGFGAFLSTGILLIVEKATEGDPWWGDEINDVKMENLLFLFGGIMLANFILYCVVAHFYKPQDPKTFQVDVEEGDEEEITSKSDDNIKNIENCHVQGGITNKDIDQNGVDNEGFDLKL